MTRSGIEIKYDTIFRAYIERIKPRKLSRKEIESVIKKTEEEFPDLEWNFSEVYSQEISRRIQAFRKSLGLEKKDKVDTIIIVDDDFKKILENKKSFIEERTNSRKLKIVTGIMETFKNKIDFKIKDKRVTIIISRD